MPSPNRTQVALLGFLSWGPMSGYDLRGVIEGSISNFWSEGFGRIYPMLAELASAGLATRTESQSPGGRPRHVYTITPAGRAALEHWLHEAPVDRPPRNERLLKLFFGARTDIEASRRLVGDYRAETEGTLEHYAETRARLESATQPPLDQRFWLMTLRSGELQAEAQLRWCDEVLSELDELATSGRKGRPGKTRSAAAKQTRRKKSRSSKHAPASKKGRSS